LPWGNNEFDRDFGESLDLVLEHMEKDVGDLGSKWSKVLENVALAYQKDELKKFFPQDAIHEKCGCSHEGMEFLYAISLELIGRLFDSKDFEQLARRYKFMK
jgi:hypothetical protein